MIIGQQRKTVWGSSVCTFDVFFFVAASTAIFKNKKDLGCLDKGSLCQCPTFKLLRITYFVGKIEFKRLFHGHLTEWAGS